MGKPNAAFASVKQRHAGLPRRVYQPLITTGGINVEDIGPHRIEDAYVGLDAGAGARVLPVTPTFWQTLDTAAFADVRRLVSCFTFTAPWSTWEMHPAGEEIVLLLSGRACLHLQHGDEPVREVVLEHAGDYVLVPAGAWHTATTSEPTTMLFVTPGEGTVHRPVLPPAAG